MGCVEGFSCRGGRVGRNSLIRAGGTPATTAFKVERDLRASWPSDNPRLWRLLKDIELGELDPPLERRR